MSQPFSFEKQYGANVETPRPLKVSEPSVNSDELRSLEFHRIPSTSSPEYFVIEGLTNATELVNLYNSMTGGPETRRKYDMDNHVRYSRYHPEYIPDTSEKLIRDSEDIINQQMMTMGMTVAATASLAIIVFMVSSTAASSSQ